MGYLISETTKEEREKIVAESLGYMEASCDGNMSGLAEMYQDYIDGKKELRKNIIVVASGPFQFAMINPVITKKSGAYQTEEECLSLSGMRPCTRYMEIEVDYLDQSFKKQHGKYSGWTAQIIQHEVDHCRGIVI